jgi:hypothetical protein
MKTTNLQLTTKLVALVVWLVVLVLGIAFGNSGGPTEERATGFVMTALALIGLISTAVSTVPSTVFIKGQRWKVITMLIGALPFLCAWLFPLGIFFGVWSTKGYQALTVFLIYVLTCIPFFFVFLGAYFFVFTFKKEK